VAITKSSTTYNSNNPTADPHAVCFTSESSILVCNSVPCYVALAAGWVGIARFGRYEAKKSLVISITVSSQLSSCYSKVHIDSIRPKLPATTILLIGPSVAVALPKSCQSSMKATTARLVGFDNWQFGSVVRNYPASTIFCPGLFDVDASQTFDHNNSTSGSALNILDTSRQFEHKYSFGPSSV